jgi:hypothetical protein
MFDCLVCGTELEFQDTDDRQEWRKETYECPNCGQWHKRYTTYQCQSSLVASDEFYCIGGKHGYELSEKEVDALREKYEVGEEFKCSKT